MFNVPKKIFATGLLAWQRRKQTLSFDPTAVKSILFIELTRLGDVITMLPVVQSFRSFMPHAEISVAVDSTYGKLLEIVPSVNNVFAFEQTERLGRFISARSQLVYQKFDLICCMSPSARNSLLTLSTPAMYKIGYFDVHDSVTPFLHRSRVQGIGVTLVSEENYFMENIYDRAAKICHALGVPYTTGISVNNAESTRLRVTETLSRHGYKHGQPYIVIHPFAGWSFREWPVSRYASFARDIVQDSSAWAVFVGTKQESFQLYQLRQELSNVPRILFLESLAIDELAMLLAQATLFVGNDSGPQHLASILGIPTIGLFGPASPSLTGPQSGQATMLFHQIECSPCGQQTCIRPDNPCMQFILTNEVLQAARTVLKSIKS